MVAAEKDWTTLHGICFSFKEHGSNKYSDAARVMSNTYSNEFINDDFQSLFTDNTRTSLKPDALTLLRDLIKNSIAADDATKTEPSYRATFVTTLVDTVPLSYSRRGSNIQCRLRTLEHFEKLLDISCDNPDLSAHIELDIDDLHFTYDFLPRDLSQVSITESAVLRHAAKTIRDAENLRITTAEDTSIVSATAAIRIIALILWGVNLSPTFPDKHPTSSSIGMNSTGNTAFATIVNGSDFQEPIQDPDTTVQSCSGPTEALFATIVLCSVIMGCNITMDRFDLPLNIDIDVDTD